MTGGFKVFTTPSFDREFKKLLKKDKKLSDILGDVVDILETNPFNRKNKHNIKKLVDIKQGEGQWRIRHGNYRFRYEIESGRVILLAIGNRKDIYR